MTEPILDQLGTNVVVLSGWKANLISGVMLAAILSGASGLFVAARLTWSYDRHLLEYALIETKVNKLWEEAIRDEVRRQMSAGEESRVEQKLDALMKSRGLNP